MDRDPKILQYPRKRYVRTPQKLRCSGACTPWHPNQCIVFQLIHGDNPDIASAQGYSLEMLASFEGRFLFIKTRKTASTSLEIELSRHCGPDDIVTPISPEDELIRMADGIYPRNYSDDPELEEAYRNILRSGNKETALTFLMRYKNRFRFYNHMSATEIREKVPGRFWEHARKVSIDRHPYEKVVSQAYFRRAIHKQEETLGLDKALEIVIAEGRYRNIDLYSIGGEIVVDILLRFEQLAQWPTTLASSLQLASLRVLPRTKVSYRGDRAPATDLLSSFQKYQIQKVCYDEFHHFGWAR